MSESGPSYEDILRDRYIISRLRQVLTRHGGNKRWRQLSREIRDANGGTVTVHRTVLPRILDDEQLHHISLSIPQLIALDKYMVLKGEGSLFARDRSLVDSLAESDSIAFYVASKYHGKLNSDAVSGWDLRAITNLLSTRLNQLHINIVQVDSLEDWRKGWSANQNGANVVVGSPLANPATDELLMKMLGFRGKKDSLPEHLPFFIVKRSTDKRTDSGFLRTRLHAVRRNAEQADSISKDHRALVFGKEVFVCDCETDYAFLLAQRIPASGHVSTVLAGLSGIGTLELARILQAGGPMKELYAWEESEKHPPILAAVYKLTITGRRKKGTKVLENRRVEGSAPVLGPLFMHYSDGVWRYDKALINSSEK